MGNLKAGGGVGGGAQFFSDHTRTRFGQKRYFKDGQNEGISQKKTSFTDDVWFLI